LQARFLFGAGFVAALACAYMAISTGLITFNKFLMHDGRFPFAIFIGAVHMICSFGFNCVLFHLCPSLYPSLTDREAKVDIDRGLVLRVLLPIAGCFALQLVLNNLAFMHCSVAFVQMMKESNVVLVYLFSLVLALETFNGKRVAILVFVISATAMTISGELNFSCAGFAIQGVSILCESLKLTLQSYSLSATGRRLDALTYVMVVAPLVLLVLLALALLVVLIPGRPEALSLPPWSVIADYHRLLMANGLLAFAMNVSHAMFIKNSSAITFILTGIIFKDVMIVLVSAIIMGEVLSPMQVTGFTMQLVGILVWSLMKMEPVVATTPSDRQVVAASQWEELEEEPTEQVETQAFASGKSSSSSACFSPATESTSASVDDDLYPGL